MQPTLKKSTSQDGSALIAVAAVLMVLGVMMAVGIDAFKLKSFAEKSVETQKKLEIIAHALSNFAQENYILPCPANPALAYNDAGYGLASAAGATSCGTARGDVPVRNLNLPEDFLFDAWGRKILYAPSPVFAVPRTVTSNVHAVCRGENEWVIGQLGSCGTRYNVNPNKAQFCCPDASAIGAGTDIQVTTKANTTIGRARDTGNMATPNTQIAVASIPAPPTTIESVAYVLVSHGSNGSMTTGVEAENSDADMDFLDEYRNLSDATNFYDDIILYRTQFQTIAETGSDSCIRPYMNLSLDCP